MIDFSKARAQMVDCQIRTNDVTDHGVLAAFGAVPREEFVPSHRRELAYIDEDVLVLEGGGDRGSRYLMEPMSLARLIQLADIAPGDFVLDIGCASGYSSAILARLCNSVVAVEEDEELVARATEKLMQLECDNAVVVSGPLDQGYPSEGPYDAIIIGGAVEQLPTALGDQLKDGGRMVVVEGRGNAGVARLYVKSEGLLSGRDAFNCAVKPLPGFERKPEFVF